MPQSSTLRVLDLDSFRPRYFSNRNQSWYAGASQAAEKRPSEGGGGFNPRIKPAELEPALAADGLSLRFQRKSRVFPQPLQSCRKRRKTKSGLYRLRKNARRREAGVLTPA